MLLTAVLQDFSSPSCSEDSSQACHELSSWRLSNSISFISVTNDGTLVVRQRNEMVPPSLILSLHNLQIQNYWAIWDAVTHVRAKLVSDGYTPYTFRRETSETSLDKQRSLVPTCYFHHMVSYWKTNDVDFSSYMCVPEVDPITKNVHHVSGDHNHILKRIGHHTCDGKFLKLNCEAFGEAMLDKNTGLTCTT